MGLAVCFSFKIMIFHVLSIFIIDYIEQASALYITNKDEYKSSYIEIVENEGIESHQWLTAIILHHSKL